jgi:hypothetical protein
MVAQCLSFSSGNMDGIWLSESPPGKMGVRKPRGSVSESPGEDGCPKPLGTLPSFNELNLRLSI